MEFIGCEYFIFIDILQALQYEWANYYVYLYPMEWKEVNNALEITFMFRHFEDAMSFMQALVPKISQLNHHPTWENTYNQIKVRLQTHYAGNQVTDKDRELARLMDKEYVNYT